MRVEFSFQLNWITFSKPPSAASCSAVLPYALTAFGFACPCDNNTSTVSGWFDNDAKIKAVEKFVPT